MVPGAAGVDALTDVAITGKGSIDGAGARWWGPVKEAKKAGKTCDKCAKKEGDKK